MTPWYVNMAPELEVKTEAFFTDILLISYRKPSRHRKVWQELRQVFFVHSVHNFTAHYHTLDKAQGFVATRHEQLWKTHKASQVKELFGWRKTSITGALSCSCREKTLCLVRATWPCMKQNFNAKDFWSNFFCKLQGSTSEQETFKLKKLSC